MGSIIIPTMLQLRVVNRGMRAISDPSLGPASACFPAVSFVLRRPRKSHRSPCPPQHHQTLYRRSTPQPSQSRHVILALNCQRQPPTSHRRRTGESFPRSVAPATPASPRKSAVQGLCRAILALDGGSPVPTPVDTPGADHQPHQL
jgi:hypothetical protein